jgi:hypothetical protein
MNKATSDQSVDDDLLEGATTAGEPDVKELIAMYASGKDEEGTHVDPTFATQVLQNLGQDGEMSECMICTSEIEGEVILPCYHSGYVTVRRGASRPTVDLKNSARSAVETASWRASNERRISDRRPYVLRVRGVLSPSVSYEKRLEVRVDLGANASLCARWTFRRAPR